MIPARGFCRRTCTTCRLNRLSGIRDATKLSRNWSGLSVDRQRNGHEIRSDVLLICNEFGTKLVIAFCRDATKLSRNWLRFSVQVQRNCCETGSVFCGEMLRNCYEIGSDLLLRCNDIGTKLVRTLWRHTTTLSRNWFGLSVAMQRNCHEISSDFLLALEMNLWREPK